MEGKLMSDEKTASSNMSSNIPEPPKFNLDELPEPPKIDDSFKINKIEKQNNLEDKNKHLEQNILPKKDNTLPNISPFPSLDELPPPIIEKPKEKKGLFSFLFKKKQKEEKVDLFPVVPDLPPPENKENKLSENLKNQLSDLNDLSFAPPGMKEENLKQEISLESKEQIKDIQENTKPETTKTELNISDIQSATQPLIEKTDDYLNENLNEKEKEMLEEGEHFVREEEMLEEGEQFLENESKLKEGEKYLENEATQKETPLSDVKGIGDAREKKLKKLGIRTAENLASLTFKDLAKKLKIPESQAKKIVSNARRITRLKKKLKQTKVKETGISDLVKKLEKERRKVEVMQKVSKITEDDVLEIKGHEELVKVLETLEKRRKELAEQERILAEREMKLASHDETYRRELEQIENLRRRLDHDIRERTQYLINLEKDYFQRGQQLAKKQSEIEAKEKELEEKHKLLKEKEEKLKIQANEIEDRALTLNQKEKKYEQIVKDLEKQDLILKEKEDDLLKREAEYIKRLDTLESHEKTILKNLEEKRKKLEQKEKEIELKEQQLRKKEKLVDKKSVAVEYEKDILETQKDKLVDDEFEQYLHEQLGLLKTTGINIDDINFVKNMPNIEKDNTIYQLIDTCRDLVKANKIREAKIFYNQLRDRYYSSNFSEKEKENIHNMLRTLYDEINLADIGRN